MRLHGVNLGIQLKSAGLILDRLEKLAAVGEPTGRDVCGQPDVGGGRLSGPSQPAPTTC
jgi:hypothetical protein